MSRGEPKDIANTSMVVKDVGAVLDDVLCDHQAYFVVIIDGHTTPPTAPCMEDMLKRPPAERKRAADVLRMWAARIEAGRAPDANKA